MRATGLWLVLTFCVICIGHGASAQTYATQPITAANASSVVPMLAWDHHAPLDAFYPATPEPTGYRASVRTGSDPDYVFSPDGRYLAHIIDEPLTLWLVDLEDGTERVFLLDDAANLTISPDWRTLAVTKPDANAYGLRTKLWNMEPLLALQRAPIGEKPNCQFRVTIGSTNLRAEARVDSASLGYAVADETYPVTVTEFAGEWVQVHGEAQPSWIGSQYGALEGDCTSLPVRLTAGVERGTIEGIVAAFSPDGRFVTTGHLGYNTRNTAVRVYSVETGELLYELDVLPAFKFSADSRLLVDRAGQFFEVATGNRLFSMPGYRSRYSQAPGYMSIFSPDSRRVAVVGEDGIVRLLDTADGTELQTFTLPDVSVSDLRFSPEGRYLAIGTYDSLVTGLPRPTYIWDLENSPEQVLTTRDTDAFVTAPDNISSGDITFLADSSGVFTIACQPDSFGVWDITAREFRFVTEETLPSNYCCNYWGMLSSDSDAIVFAYRDREHLELQFVHLETGEVLTSLRVPAHLGSHVISPDWRWILTQDDQNAVTVWGVPVNAVVPTLPPTATRTPTPTITPTPPGFVPTAGPTGDGYPFVISREARQATATAQAVILAQTPTTTFSPSPTPVLTSTPRLAAPQPGTEVITAANYEQVTLLNAIPFPEPANRHYRLRTLTSEDSRLVMAGDRTLSVWDVLSGDFIMTVGEHPDYITGMDVSRDGRYALTLANDLIMRLWSLETGALVYSSAVEGRNTGDGLLQLSPDNRRALVLEWTAQNSLRLRIRDIETGEISLDESAPQGLISGGFRSDGVAVWWSSRAVFLSERLQTGQHSWYRIPDTNNIVPSSDLTQLATFDTVSVNFRVWDTSGKSDSVLFQGHTAPVRALYFSPDGRMLVSFDIRDNMLMWNAATGEMLAVIPDGMLPIGMPVGSNRLLLAADDGAPIILHLQQPLSAVSLSKLRMSADGTTITANAGPLVLCFGVPTSERLAYASVPARVVPSAINVRPQPSLDAIPSGMVESGVVVVAGRDASGRFVYLPSVNGWVLADPVYLDLGGVTVEQLPLRES